MSLVHKLTFALLASAASCSSDSSSDPVEVDAGSVLDAGVRSGDAALGDGAVSGPAIDGDVTVRPGLDAASDAALVDGATSTSPWSAPVALVEDLGRLAIGNQVHVVGHANGQLVHRRSANGGVTWTAPTVIASAAGNFPAMYGGFHAVGDSLYLVTADADMDSSASAGGRQIQFRRSDDNGANWSTPAAMNSVSSPMYRGRVAAYQNFVHFAGTSGPTSGASSLWYFRSQNSGATWAATPLANNLGTYGGGQTLAVDGATVHIGYTDANGSVGAGPTLYIRSTDNGATWSTPVVIGESTAASSRQARVQLSAADGRVFACWQREPSTSGGTLPADRIGYNTSNDGGLKWGTARVLPEDTGIDRNHHQLWMAPGGGVHIVWRHGDSGDSVPDPAAYKYSPDYGATWQPRVMAIDTTATVGSNHPWALVANAGSVHLLTGPDGAMQYAHRAVP